jgi:hypothetical protein
MLSGNTMIKLLKTLRENAAKNAEYARIRDEIAGLPADVARELGIFPGEAHYLAKKAVWG